MVMHRQVAQARRWSRGGDKGWGEFRRAYLSQFSPASLRCDSLSLHAVDPCVVRRITSAKYKLEGVVGEY